MRGSVLVALALVAVAQCARAAPSDAKVDCSKLDEVLDELGGAQGITSLNDKYKIATNAEEFTKRCTEMQDAIKTLRKYNKECVTSLTQQVLSAILRTRSQMNELSCKPDSAEFKEAVAGSKCIQENSLEAVKAAERKTILGSQVLYDADIKDEKERVRRACCAVLDSKTFFLEATKDKCSKHSKLYSDYVESYTSEAMGLICPDADKLECNKLSALKTEGVALKSKFFLSPMIKLVKTLDH